MARGIWRLDTGCRPVAPNVGRPTSPSKLALPLSVKAGGGPQTRTVGKGPPGHVRGVSGWRAAVSLLTLDRGRFGEGLACKGRPARGK